MVDQSDNKSPVKEIEGETEDYINLDGSSEKKKKSGSPIKLNSEGSPKMSGDSALKIMGENHTRKTTELSTYTEAAIKEKLYSNDNLVDISRLVSRDLRETVLLNPEMVILEGELMKYKPGVQHSYVKRWVKVTSNELRYYKNRWAANCFDEKPLFTTTFESLRAVYRVNMKLPKGTKIDGNLVSQVGKNKITLQHFEIFTGQSDIPYDDENEELRNVPGANSEYYPAHYELSKTDRSIMKHLHPNQNNSHVHVLNIKQDHLMPSPSRDKSEKPSYSHGGKKSLSGSINQSTVNLRSSNKYGNLHDVSQELHSKLNKSSEKKLSQNSLLSPEKGERGSVGKDKAAFNFVKSIEDLASWSGREKEWYYSEKRLLFASTSQKEREIWLSILSWLIEEKAH